MSVSETIATDRRTFQSFRWYFWSAINRQCSCDEWRSTITLKEMAGLNCGKQKETMASTYKTVCRPFLNYAAPVWSTQLAKTTWSKLQACQKAALRTSTGCHLITAPDHLHSEASERTQWNDHKTICTSVSPKQSHLP